MENKQLPPKAVSALVFGILSVFFSFCFISFILMDLSSPSLSSSSSSIDFVGLLFIVVLFISVVIFAVLGLNKSKKGFIAVNKNPENYRNVGMLKVARITSYVGAFSSFTVLILIWILARILR